MSAFSSNSISISLRPADSAHSSTGACCGCAARPDFAVHGAGVGFHLEALVPVVPETQDGLASERELPGGKQIYGLHPGDGALGFRVEAAQGLYPIVEQIDAVGQGGAHGVQVQQGAAPGELAVLEHRFHAAVTVAFQVAAKIEGVQALAGFQYQAVAGDVFARRQPVHESAAGYDHDALAHCRQAVQGQQAFGDDVPMRREVVVGQCLPVGEHQDLRFGRAGVKRQFPLQGIRSLGVGRYRQQRAGPSMQLADQARGGAARQRPQCGSDPSRGEPGQGIQQLFEHVSGALRTSRGAIVASLREAHHMKIIRAFLHPPAR